MQDILAGLRDCRKIGMVDILFNFANLVFHMHITSLEQIKIDIDQNTIQSIIFDLDGTLYSAKSKIEFAIIPNFQKQTAKYLNCSAEEAIKTIQKYKKEFGTGVLGLEKYHNINPTEFLNEVFKGIDISNIIPYKGLDNLIKKLSSKSELYILSNSNNLHVERVLKHLGLFDYFIKIFTTENFNFQRKPNQVVYEKILKELRISPPKLLNFDDSYLNLEIANDYGIRTILVSNGISEPPLFWEMHKRIFHPPPSFLSHATHDIVSVLKFITGD